MKKVTSPALQIEYVPIARLKPNPRNARKHGRAQIDEITRSIRAFGFNVPIVTDGMDRVVAGHGRLEAAKRLGLEAVPVIRLEHLTPEQVLAFGIADNRLAEHSRWDEALLGEVFRELSAADLDFTLTGFSVPEIDLLIEGLSPASDSLGDPADYIPVNGGAPAVSRIGDVWQLGAHRLCCGNALEEPCYEALLQGQRARLVFTDPPYNVRVQGHVSGKGRIRHSEFAMASGEMSPEEFQAFLTTVLGTFVRYTTPGALHFVCIDWRHVPEMTAAARSICVELKNICVWVKQNAGMGSLYRSQHELVFVFKNDRTPHRNNVQLGRHGRNRTNVWQYPSSNNFGRRGEEGNLLALHPTVKPVALIADAILDCSARRDIILDPFLGSGSSLIAAERVGRTCYGIEIDPAYVDLAIRRWQQYTGETAVHAMTERSFKEAEDAAHG